MQISNKQTYIRVLLTEPPLILSKQFKFKQILTSLTS